ncbi:H2A super protein [Geranomyces variabilis]|uniref:H2A super protein n=1 Tax=Geranomyces variabilis TaxID=109894 RepID=A0AAD5XTK9_9FUNG|nr:H2A super protein [Geranomyces variabilis]
MNKRYKTKFPVARIKKIMRTDDDVGKVAQVTPVLISKALELFMATLIQETCKEARARQAKKLTPAHLKQTIESTETFDFLVDLVANLQVPAPSATSEAGEGATGKGKGGRGRGAGRAAGKTKTEAENDD